MDWKEFIGVWKSQSKGEGKLITLIDLVRDNSLNIEKAAAKATMTVEQFEKIMNQPLEWPPGTIILAYNVLF